jgi:hypothetical protein
VGVELRQASVHVVKGQSLVVPLIIDGLPDVIEALGRRWQRKREFHLTAVAARVIEQASGGADDAWDRVISAASGRWLGPIEARDEVRRVTHTDRPELQTLIVMAACPGLAELHRSLSEALGATMRPPPAHVTVYSTDPAQGIGIVDETELAERAPPLSQAEQDEVRLAMSFP